MSADESKSYVPEPYTRVFRKLRELEKEHNIKIIYAAETHANIWGFLSDPPKFNVSFIYVKQISEYLSCGLSIDAVNCTEFDDISIQGYDIKSVCNFVSDSTPLTYEFLKSPTRYLHRPEYAELTKMLDDLFTPVRGYVYYRTMAVNLLPIHESKGVVPVRKVLCAIRCVLAMSWIKENLSIPPISFIDLLSGLKDEELKEKIRAYFKLKNSSTAIYANQDMIDTDIKKFLVSMLYPNGDFDNDASPSRESRIALKQFCINTIKSLGNF